MKVLRYPHGPLKAGAGALAMISSIALGLPVHAASHVGAVPHASPRQASPTWASYNRTTKTAHLRVIAAYGSDSYNFNGGSKGQFTFTVPVGAKVVVRFTNNSSMMPHAAEVVKYTGSLPVGPQTPAFTGAATPGYQHGTQPGTTVTFRFTASKAGKYLLICPVHNHVQRGHWDWFIVSRTATTATGTLKA